MLWIEKPMPRFILLIDFLKSLCKKYISSWCAFCIIDINIKGQVVFVSQSIMLLYAKSKFSFQHR